ncbi:MAG: hypothetical protein NC324_10305 [Bacteroides sp.]|nr:hypothetical protein [Bacteroides sp.]
MSIVLKEIREFVRNEKTGDIHSYREYKEIKRNNSAEPPYLKTYRGMEGGDIRKIKDVPMGFWAIILDNMGSENAIRIGEHLKASMAEEMDVSLRVINKWIKALMDYRVLIRKFDAQGKPVRAEYIVCPYISAIGKWKDIYEQQKIYAQCNSVIQYNLIPVMSKKAEERKFLPSPSQGFHSSTGKETER